MTTSELEVIACFHPNVVIYDNVTVGDRVILHAGVVIGADGFGYVRGDMGYHKFPQIGTVIIEDDVELGANSTIDRGRWAGPESAKEPSSTTWSTWVTTVISASG